MSQDVREELAALIQLLGEQTTMAFQSGELPQSYVHNRVTEGFTAQMYAPWFEDGCWRGGATEWVAGNAAAAEHYAAAGGATWTPSVLSVLVGDADAVVVYVVECVEARDARTTRAVFLERWVRGEDGWRLARHLSEKA